MTTFNKRKEEKKEERKEVRQGERIIWRSLQIAELRLM